VILLQVNTGELFITEIVIVTVAPDTKFTVSVGVNVAVITEVPAPTTVHTRSAKEITEVVPEEYVKEPVVLATGTGRVKTPFPYVLRE
jgi:hypothetical protein